MTSKRKPRLSVGEQRISTLHSYQSYVGYKPKSEARAGGEPENHYPHVLGLGVVLHRVVVLRLRVRKTASVGEYSVVKPTV